MTEQPERPASLQRRRPRPAPDEHIDPVDYTPPAPATPQPVAQQVSSPPVQAAPVAEPPPLRPSAAGAGRAGNPRFSSGYGWPRTSLI